jgi:hypothetical protein
MHEICAKVRFSQLMNQAAGLYPAAFAFWPPTLVLPEDWGKVGAAFGEAAKTRRGSGGGGGGGWRSGRAAEMTAPGGTGGAGTGGKVEWFIVKPDKGSQGDGIFLTNSREDLESKIEAAQIATALNNGEPLMNVMQRYLMNPLLIGGVKFDLRLYVLMTGADGFRTFLSKEGLVRFCTEPYADPSAKTLSHVQAGAYTRPLFSST